MTDETRMVAVSAEQARILDEIVVPSLMLSGDTETASHMMALSLAYRFATPLPPLVPDNVVELHGHSRKVPA